MGHAYNNQWLKREDCEVSKNNDNDDNDNDDNDNDNDDDDDDSYHLSVK